MIIWQTPIFTENNIIVKPYQTFCSKLDMTYSESAPKLCHALTLVLFQALSSPGWASLTQILNILSLKDLLSSMNQNVKKTIANKKARCFKSCLGMWKEALKCELAWSRLQ